MYNVYNYADDDTAGTPAVTIDSLCISLQTIAGDMLYDLYFLHFLESYE